MRPDCASSVLTTEAAFLAASSPAFFMFISFNHKEARVDEKASPAPFDYTQLDSWSAHPDRKPGRQVEGLLEGNWVPSLGPPGRTRLCSPGWGGNKKDEQKIKTIYIYIYIYT